MECPRPLALEAQKLWYWRRKPQLLDWLEELALGLMHYWMPNNLALFALETAAAATGHGGHPAFVTNDASSLPYRSHHPCYH